MDYNIKLTYHPKHGCITGCNNRVNGADNAVAALKKVMKFHKLKDSDIIAISVESAREFPLITEGLTPTVFLIK